jgi:transglutaminase-like putative cysteine protease
MSTEPTPLIDPTPIGRRFRLASYVTLLIACASLVWASYDLVPMVLVIAALMAPLILAAYLLEERWSMPGWVANLIGLLIAGLAGGWFIYESVRTEGDEPLKKIMPWPTFLVPMVGPLLLVLLAAKLLRPKTVADHWGLQIIGLACVGLGCTTVSFTDPGIFAGLLIAYLLSILWCLALFFQYRERLVRPAAEQPRSPRPRQVVSWAVPIFVLGMFGFLFFPRSTAIWQVPRGERMESGLGDEAGIDLNKTGTLSLDPEVAFEVTASNDPNGASSKLDLPLDQRWRGPVYRYYYNGGWHPKNERGGGASTSEPPSAPIFNPEPKWQDGLPPYPGGYYLTIHIKEKIGPVALVADPVYQPGKFPPVVQLVGNERRQWLLDNTGALGPPWREPKWPGKRYRQATIPPPEPFLSHPVRDNWVNENAGDLRTAPQVPGLREWTENLLQHVVNRGLLSPDALKRDVNGDLPPRRFEQIALALEQYLSVSSDYTYSLELQRGDETIDPTFDFLKNTKTGHCNRFASGLALMLRTLGIPCQVVSGYRGCESRGDGTYEVHQCQAHTWVEALVPRPSADPARDRFHWLSLDPTPGTAAAEANTVANRFYGVDLDLRRMYRNLIINYTPENRDDFFRDLWQAAKAISAAIYRAVTAGGAYGMRARIAASLTFFVLATLFVLTVRWVRRRLLRLGLWRAAPFPGTAFYQKTLAVLARRGLRPAASQTPREFAESVALSLTGGESAPGDAVRRIADLYYRVRYGGRPLSPAETSDVNAQIARLAAALAAN